jgi:ferric-dicitrate binding protein FerR (iron transport regulator)
LAGDDLAAHEQDDLDGHHDDEDDEEDDWDHVAATRAAEAAREAVDHRPRRLPARRTLLWMAIAVLAVVAVVLGVLLVA